MAILNIAEDRCLIGGILTAAKADHVLCADSPGDPGLKSLCENCAAPLALDNSVPLSPALARWANDHPGEFRRSAARLCERLDYCASRTRLCVRLDHCASRN